jgi:hypothetical protein
LIDPDSREAEIWTGPSLPNHTLAGTDALTTPLLPGFCFPLEDLFA